MHCDGTLKCAQGAATEPPRTCGAAAVYVRRIECLRASAFVQKSEIRKLVVYFSGILSQGYRANMSYLDVNIPKLRVILRVIYLPK